MHRPFGTRGNGSRNARTSVSRHGPGWRSDQSNLPPVTAKKKPVPSSGARAADDEQPADDNPKVQS